MNLNSIAYKLISLRQHYGLSIEQVALQNGLTVTQLASFECGKLYPSIIELSKLAKYYNVDVRYFNSTQPQTQQYNTQQYNAQTQQYNTQTQQYNAQQYNTQQYNTQQYNPQQYNVQSQPQYSNQNQGERITYNKQKSVAIEQPAKRVVLVIHALVCILILASFLLGYATLSVIVAPFGIEFIAPVSFSGLQLLTQPKLLGWQILVLRFSLWSVAAVNGVMTILQIIRLIRKKGDGGAINFALKSIYYLYICSSVFVAGALIIFIDSAQIVFIACVAAQLCSCVLFAASYKSKNAFKLFVQ